MDPRSDPTLVPNIGAALGQHSTALIWDSTAQHLLSSAAQVAAWPVLDDLPDYTFCAPRRSPAVMCQRAERPVATADIDHLNAARRGHGHGPLSQATKDAISAAKAGNQNAKRHPCLPPSTDPSYMKLYQRIRSKGHCGRLDCKECFPQQQQQPMSQFLVKK